MAWNERYRDLFAREFHAVGDRSDLFDARSLRRDDGGAQLVHTQSQCLRWGAKGREGSAWPKSKTVRKRNMCLGVNVRMCNKQKIKHCLTTTGHVDRPNAITMNPCKRVPYSDFRHRLRLLLSQLPQVGIVDDRRGHG
jgi:hypothetical protein